MNKLKNFLASLGFLMKVDQGSINKSLCFLEKKSDKTKNVLQEAKLHVRERDYFTFKSVNN